MDQPRDTTSVHANDWQSRRLFADGPVVWCPAEEPDYLSGGRRTTGRLRHCSFCGSMHPAELLVAIKCGARVELADMKYGWPHKLYVHDAPNPHAGTMESRSYKSCPTPEEVAAGEYIQHWDGGYDPNTGERSLMWIHKGEPAPATTWGKFYTVHLQDASPDERAVIEAAVGLHFEFANDAVRWMPLQPLAEDS